MEQNNKLDMPQYIDRELDIEDRISNQNQYVGAPSFFEAFSKQVGVNASELAEMTLASQARRDRQESEFMASIGQTNDPVLNPDQLNKMLFIRIHSIMFHCVLTLSPFYLPFFPFL